MTVQLLQCVDIKTQSFLLNWLWAQVLGPVLQDKCAGDGWVDGCVWGDAGAQRIPRDRN